MVPAILYSFIKDSRLLEVANTVSTVSCMSNDVICGCITDVHFCPADKRSVIWNLLSSIRFYEFYLAHYMPIVSMTNTAYANNSKQCTYTKNLHEKLDYDCISLSVHLCPTFCFPNIPCIEVMDHSTPRQIVKNDYLFKLNIYSQPKCSYHMHRNFHGIKILCY